MLRVLDKYRRPIAFFFLINLLVEIIAPNRALALTSGPAQPEAAGFEPVGTSEMVDPFSGDFTYNIPLLDVDGYPVNISYKSGVSMDQEATWTGLGWNINVGAVNRNMRGLPDDFNGEAVSKDFNSAPNTSYGINVGITGKLFGIPSGGNANGKFGIGVSHNNYTGYNFTQTYGITISICDEASKDGGSMSLGMSSSADGTDLSPSISYSRRNGNAEDYTQKGSVSLGTSFNSRSGMKSLTLSGSFSEKEKKGKSNPEIASASKSAAWDFAATTYVPQIQMPYHSYCFGFGATVGGVLFGGDGDIYLNGSYSRQKLQYKHEELPAYGYLHAQNGQSKSKVMQDFNREKDGAFTESTSDLPLTNFTYDIFSVTGQGVGGSYRPFRNDIGYVFDSRVTNDSENDNVSGELNLGQTVHGDIDYLHTSNYSESGAWLEDNYAASKLQFTSKSANNNYENVFFKEAGEKNVDESSFYENLFENSAIRIPIEEGGYTHLASNKFENEYSAQKTITNKRSHANGRMKRNQFFQYLTYSEYDEAALQKNLKTVSSTSLQVYTGAKNDHIAEITTLKTDGSRYVYGLPTYNTKQEEVSFSVTNPGSVPTDGLVSYSAGTDDTEDNTKGIDNFFSKTTLPAFATGYLLTAVLSPDYVDVTGDGPTPDDLGKYTLFRYSKNTAAYKWRTPYGKSGASYANYDAGLKTLTDDDKASYVRGEKEIWFLDTIRTKNYVSIFSKQTRRDGLGAAIDGSGIDAGSSQKLLEKITLYSLPDFKANGVSAFKIKEVNFVYDYSLCTDGTTGVPNNDGTNPPGNSTYELSNTKGKLTLKKIFFTYGSSKRAQLSPYVFSYITSVNGSAIKYDAKAYDRWGNYKPEATGSNPLNADYPYTDQDTTNTNKYARLWNMNQVTLPSGGKILVDYESDDYAYVQDRPAMQMFKVIGAVQSTTSTAMTTTLFTAGLPAVVDASNKPLYFLYQLNGTNPYTDYTKGVEDLYFRFYTPVNSQGSEYVSGYSKIVGTGTITISATTYGYVKLAGTGTGDKVSSVSSTNFNPVSRAAWQFARLHTPRLSYNTNASSWPAPTTSPTTFLQALKGSFKSIVQTFQGANGALAVNGVGASFDANKSWIRLSNPTKKKLGGGVRVKKIKISDEWGTMLTNTTNHLAQTFSYGQEYDYTTTDDATGYTISTGVASYEPSFGADENPFKKPLFQQENEKRKILLLAPDNDRYLEEPFGESFFPSASVGYSKVTVKNLQRSGVTKNATGKVVNEFYTAKDFPTKTSRTLMKHKRAKTDAIFKLFNINFKDYLAATEGYVVETNDMHGKPKRNLVYAEDQKEPISGVEYVYKVDGNGLNNKVSVIKPNGTLKNANIGIDFDVVADFRESKNTTSTFGIHANLYFFFAGLIPVVVPPIIPSVSESRTRFRSAVVTKVVNRFGILEKTIVFNDGSSVETKNILWNSETGEVALTKTSTEFNDDIYSFKYPAHWAYSGMGPAYSNQGMDITLTVSSGSVTNALGYSFLNPGDELIAAAGTTSLNTMYWVVQDGSNLKLKNVLGSDHANVTAGSFKISRSGRRNMQAMEAGAFTSFRNPMPTVPSTGTVQWSTLDASFGIINATSTEFKDSWNIFCNCGISAAPSLTLNPYIVGVSGNWRQKKQYTYLSTREQSKTNGNSNIRSDGTFKVFAPFWNTPASTSYWTANNTNWTSVSEVTEFSPYGVELENVDPLMRYSSAVYGYNHSLPVAVASNTRYKQLGFDSFEDYDFGTCSEDHFGFKTLGAAATKTTSSTYQKYSHTGRRSIKVAANTSTTVTRPLKSCNSSN